MLSGEQHRSRLEARLDAEAAHEFQGYALIDAVEADNVRRDPGVTDYDRRWRACGGAALERLLDGAIEAEIAARQAAVERQLQRALTRLVGQTRADDEVRSDA
jgi:hypothetical protein